VEGLVQPLSLLMCPAQVSASEHPHRRPPRARSISTFDPPGHRRPTLTSASRLPAPSGLALIDRTTDRGGPFWVIAFDQFRRSRWTGFGDRHRVNSHISDMAVWTATSQDIQACVRSRRPSDRVPMIPSPRPGCPALAGVVVHAEGLAAVRSRSAARTAHCSWRDGSLAHRASTTIVAGASAARRASVSATSLRQSTPG
jgi:hypothetical protein